MSDFPILRLELEGMRHTLLTALAKHQDDVQKFVEAETARFVTEYDYAATVRRIMPGLLDDIVRETLRREFGYGGKGHDVVREVLARSRPEPAE